MTLFNEEKKLKTLENNEKNNFSSFQGKHLLVELYGCNKKKLDDESYLRCLINNSAKLANATILNLISNKFEPQGVTAIALLAESHLSIHTWPEANYAALDIFTCGNNMKPDLACHLIIDQLEAKEHIVKTINRHFPTAIENQVRNSQ